MSGLTAALAAYSGPCVVASTPRDGATDTPASERPSQRFLQRSPSERTAKPEFQPTPSSSSGSSLSLVVPPFHRSSERPNEYLAVLLPKHLWKPDSAAELCDNFFCRVKFGLFERRHHCRKCGGVYCKSCTSQTIPLLDTTNLPFVHPPPNVSIESFESPNSPLVPARICDQCWDQIHGCPSNPRTPDLVRHSSPISMLQDEQSYFEGSGNSSFTSGPATPPSADPLNLGPSISKRHSLRSKASTSSLRSNPPSRKMAPHASLSALPEPSYGELDAYPLRRASVLCKASGGGRWQPKTAPVLVGYRTPVPGGKAPFEVQLEREAELERVRRDNPIIKDGEFQLRYPRSPEPTVLSRSFQLSTF